MTEKNSPNGQVYESRQDFSIPLEELITEIDTETGETVRDYAVHKAADYGYEQYIRFFLEDILVAIPLSSALEIGYWPQITPLPNLPTWILGVSNIRGEIVSVVDLKGFFKLSSRGLTRNRRFIIVHNRDMKVGIVVDRIMGIFSLDRRNAHIVQSNPYEAGELSSYISGVVVLEESEKTLLNIIDIDKLLSSPRMNAFRSE